MNNVNMNMTLIIMNINFLLYIVYLVVNSNMFFEVSQVLYTWFYAAPMQKCTSKLINAPR